MTGTTLIVGHYDAHGVAFSAARAAVLRKNGVNAQLLVSFPETGADGLSSGELVELVASRVAELGGVDEIELVDIPIDVERPGDAVSAVEALARLARRVVIFDHHTVDSQVLGALAATPGVEPRFFQTGLEMAADMMLLYDQHSRLLTVVGLVADRDPSVLELEPRAAVEWGYMPLANALDVVVRRPQSYGFASLTDVAERLSHDADELTRLSKVEYPPSKILSELPPTILARSEKAVLVSWTAPPAVSQWLPKTLEQLLLKEGRDVAVAIVTAYDRNGNIVGYDVRILRYWLSDPARTPRPFDVATRIVPATKVVGHENYVSIRFLTDMEARRAAFEAFSAYADAGKPAEQWV